MRHVYNVSHFKIQEQINVNGINMCKTVNILNDKYSVIDYQLYQV